MFNDGSAGGKSSPLLIGVAFTSNSAGYGGAIANYGHNGMSCPVLTDVAFTGNTAEGFGGAIFNFGDASGNSSPVLANVTFTENKAGDNGGAIFNLGNYFSVSSPALTNITFSGNSAEDNGGAIYNHAFFNGETSPKLTNVVFSANKAGSSGGAMFNSGGQGFSNPSLTNVTFVANRAEVGGALYNIGRGDGTGPSLRNVILWGNYASRDGMQIANSRAYPNVAFSLVEGGIDGSGVWNYESEVVDGCGNLAGNASDDPLFVEPINADDAPTTVGNLRLLPGSPAIDAGTNDTVTSSTDIEGKPRIVDGNRDGNAVVDLGAYETPVSYELAVRLDGAGYGEIVPNPAGGPCESPCIGVYPDGTEVHAIRACRRWLVLHGLERRCRQ